MSVEEPQRDGGTHRGETDTTAGARAGHRRHGQRAGRASPAVTDHARRRWAERAPSTDIDIETAWQRSVAVGAPQQACDGARLYAPCDVVFRLQNGRITSVWPANYDSLDTGHLGQCAQCGNLERFDGAVSTCRWCQDRSTTVKMENGVTVRFEGGQ